MKRKIENLQDLIEEVRGLRDARSHVVAALETAPLRRDGVACELCCRCAIAIDAEISAVAKNILAAEKELLKSRHNRGLEVPTGRFVEFRCRYGRESPCDSKCVGGLGLWAYGLGSLKGVVTVRCDDLYTTHDDNVCYGKTWQEAMETFWLNQNAEVEGA